MYVSIFVLTSSYGSFVPFYCPCPLLSFLIVYAVKSELNLINVNMIIQENKIKKRLFLKDFGALRCRSRAALIDNKLVFL